MTGNVETVRTITSQLSGRRSALRSLSLHWPEYLMEAAELGLFMVSACVFTALLEHPASPAHQALSNGFLRRALMGCAMGLTAVAIFYSGWGRQSGAHMNPAITLTFLRLKKINGWDAAFYVAAQFLGGILGVSLASLLLMGLLSDHAVRFAATVPGPSGTTIAFAAEVLISFILLTVVLNVSNNARVAHLTGLSAGLLIFTYITFEAPISGMSMNPARTFGSAYFAQVFDSIWIYFIAPLIGFLLAAELYVRRHGLQAVLCAKFHHDHSHRCIFRCGHMKKSMSATNNL
jgi:aquaporin Z